MEGESFYKAWEHFKMLIKKCPHHEFPEWMQLHVFYNGLDKAARGALMNITYKDAYKIIENMRLNSCQWPIE
ncbi:Retrotransposon gag protein [Gossypium australe]|uniref:Retrotransposon gag protein n=1 Tax=Gossypium australe TaxID=47621 RepID=A0A5B6VWD6_9ROSI|nr:Retrotransposon gag protein [Gossypium australe]